MGLVPEFDLIQHWLRVVDFSMCSIIVHRRMSSDWVLWSYTGTYTHPWGAFLLLVMSSLIIYGYSVLHSWYSFLLHGSTSNEMSIVEKKNSNSLECTLFWIFFFWNQLEKKVENLLISKHKINSEQSILVHLKFSFCFWNQLEFWLVLKQMENFSKQSFSFEFDLKQKCVSVCVELFLRPTGLVALSFPLF